MSERLEKSLRLETLVKLVVEKPAETLVVTANNRLARLLKYKCNEAVGKDNKAWDTFRIVTLQTWVRELWAAWQLSDAGAQDCDTILLSVGQNVELWGQLIQKHMKEAGLPPSAARSAAQAFDLLEEYLITHEELMRDYENESEEEAAQGKITYQYEGLIASQKNEYLSDRVRAVTMWSALRRLVEGDGVVTALGSKLPERVVFAGFDSLLVPQMTNPRGADTTPHSHGIALTALVAQLEDAGVGVDYYFVPEPGRTPLAPSGKSYDLLRNEIAAAGQWAREILEKEDRTTAPRIGILVQDLPGCVATVQGELQGKLFPEVYKADNLGKDMGREQARIYNVSYADSLDKSPAIMAAMACLKLAFTAVDFDTLSVLLRSPWFKDTEQGRLQRLNLEVRARTSGRGEFERYFIGGCKSEFVDALMKPDDKPLYPKSMMFPSEWADEFKRVLDKTKWLDCEVTKADIPAARTAHEGFSKQLDALGTHDVFGDDAKCDVKKALALLGQQLKSATCRSAGGDHAPVQVMGLLEAVGQPFTHLWVCGLDDRVWPPPTRYNSFLPVGLQRYFNLPHSSPQWNSAFARRYLQQLILQTSEECVLSHARSDAEGRELRASALLTQLCNTVHDVQEQKKSTLFREIRGAGDVLESVADEVIEFDDKAHVKRGTGAIKDYFTCPFKGYVTSRFGVQPLERPEVGVNSLTWGTLVHGALEHVWTAINNGRKGDEFSSVALRKIVHGKGDGLDMLVQSAVNDTVRDWKSGWGNQALLAGQNSVDSDEAIHASVEHDLLCSVANLVKRWLLFEAGRDGDFDVTLLEGQKQDGTANPDTKKNKKQTVMLGARGAQIELSVTIDRIDELADGNKTVIDYKTGDSSEIKHIKVDKHERIAEPQLPIYALKENPQSVAFGFVRSKKRDLEGEEVAQHFEAWQKALNVAAADILAGKCDVLPTKPGTEFGKDCAQCGLMGLCRFYESKNAYGESEDSNGGDD